MLRKWLLSKLGVIRASYEAELYIIENIQRLGIQGSQMDDVTEIVMDAMKKVRG